MLFKLPIRQVAEDRGNRQFHLLNFRYCTDLPPKCKFSEKNLGYSWIYVQAHRVTAWLCVLMPFCHWVLKKYLAYQDTGNCNLYSTKSFSYNQSLMLHAYVCYASLLYFSKNCFPLELLEVQSIVFFIPSLFYEAWLGIAVFIELYDSAAVFGMFKFMSMAQICVHCRAYSYCSK